MGAWLGDITVSIRQLAKTPGFTAAAVAVLALGIGLNAAMFSLVYALGLMGRPYADPKRLVQLYSSRTTQPDAYRAFSYPAYRVLAAEEGPFTGVLAHNPTIVGISEGATARRTVAVLVTPNYFDVLGVPIVQGRGFTAEEGRPGQDIPVAIAAWSYWERTGFDPSLVGSTIRINERPFTIVGVTPRGFTGTMTVFGPELFFPFGVFHTLANLQEDQRDRQIDRPDAFNVFLVARLGDGVSIDAAAARLTPTAQALARAFPGAYQDARLTLAPLPRFGTSTSPSDESVLGFLAAVMLGLTAAVLLTVCLNLASMLMARGRARRKEFAIRLALGGSRGRIVRQLLTEGLLLSLAGGIGGVALGLGALDRLVDAFAASLPIAIVLDGALSPALVAATLIFCVLATTWFALGPALRHSRADVVVDLKPNAGEDAPERRRRFMPRNPLLVSQVALSLALLIAAGLFVRMAQTAIAVDFGFRADATVLAEVDGDLAGYTAPQTLDVYASIERRLSALPGVESAAVGALVPLGLVNIDRAVRRAGIHVPDGVEPSTPETGRAFQAPWNAVSGGYFAAMGVSLLQGRTFTEAESFIAGGPSVAIIDEALARRLWPDGTALGQRIEFVERSRPAGEPPPTVDIVGIVGSTHRQLFEKELPGGVYVPFARGARGNAWFHVRPRGTEQALIDSVRAEIRAAAPGLPLFNALTYETHIESSIEFWALTLTAGLFGAFGALALVVALVGIYGVMSYSVVRRTREIGIRMAVGATTGAVRRMILGEGLAITATGVAIGWVLGIGVGRVLASLFVDVAAFDVLTFTLAPVGFLAAALVAAWWPARRATALNPVSALRTE